MIEIITKSNKHHCICPWCESFFKFDITDTECDSMYLRIVCPVCKNKIKLKDNQGNIYNGYKKCD